MSVLLLVLAVMTLLGLCVAGTIGFTRGVYLYLERRKYRPAVTIGLSALAALLGFSMLWPYYDLWWPFSRLFRRRPVLRIVAPIVCVMVIFVSFGFFVARYTAYPTFMNDTSQPIRVSGCTVDTLYIQPGQNDSGDGINEGARACSILAGTESYGCLWLPAHIHSHMTIKLSTFTPLAKMTKSCE